MKEQIKKNPIENGEDFHGCLNKWFAEVLHTFIPPKTLFENGFNCGQKVCALCFMEAWARNDG